jgi:catechol 2,3-dioxygenase-like lactoylglutathione lyase family enzyme
MAFLQLTAIIVEDYDDAITFFTQALGFELAEDSPARTNGGRPKRWVVGRTNGHPARPRRGRIPSRCDR